VYWYSTERYLLALGCTEKRLAPDEEGGGVPRLVAPSAIPGKVAIKARTAQGIWANDGRLHNPAQVSATRESARMVGCWCSERWVSSRGSSMYSVRNRETLALGLLEACTSYDRTLLGPAGSAERSDVPSIYLPCSTKGRLEGPALPLRKTYAVLYPTLSTPLNGKLWPTNRPSAGFSDD
jgi:hypothetical protein